MLTYRAFRNTDPPLLTALWRAHVGQPGFPGHVTMELLEQIVFSRLYFEHAGLILAFDDEQLVGCAHAGFAPNDARDGLNREIGVISLVLVQPGGDRSAAACELVRQCEAYLRARGAKEILGGGVRPNCPFYTGLYGFGDPPGVMDDDEPFRAALVACGFQPARQVLVYQRELAAFEAPIDRQQMEIRRRMVAEVAMDVPVRNWWEACLWTEFELTRIEIVPRSSKLPAAWALFRELEPLGSNPSRRHAGLVDLYVEEAHRRRGLAVFLLCEAFRGFGREGVASVTAQIDSANSIVPGLLNKLGMKPMLTGTVYRKT